MAASLTKISERLNLPEDKLIEESLKAWLEREIKLAEEDIAVFRDRYGVPTITDLDRKIKKGEIYSHPALEDLIAWENLEDHITWLKDITYHPQNPVQVEVLPWEYHIPCRW